MLLVKSLDDINYLAVEDSGRIKIRPNLGNVLYTYKSFHFSYDIVQHLPPKVKSPPRNLADNYARFSDVQYHFTDRKTGNELSFPYYQVEVWSEIDEEFRDIFLIHELNEIQHRLGNQSKKTSHERAERKTEFYIKNNLSPNETERFRKMLKELPKRINRPTNTEVYWV